MNRRCTPNDPLYPLVDFLTRSADKIMAMRDKRYDNTQYRAVRGMANVGTHEPDLGATVDHLVGFLRSTKLIAEEDERVSV